MRGKVALITGASRGIGSEIAKALALEGATVILNYSKDIEGAELTLAEIIANGGYGKIIKKDLENTDNCKILIDEIIKDFGKIDILINNAGISKVNLFIESTTEDINSIFNINLLSPVILAKEAVSHMLGRGSGNIINISSMWGEVGAALEVLYSTTKGGINTFTKALAKEVAGMGIRVNAIAPGAIDTSMNRFLDPEDREDLENEIPMMRFGESSEIAKMVVFLCKDGCDYLTGQVIRIDGGMI